MLFRGFLSFNLDYPCVVFDLYMFVITGWLGCLSRPWYFIVRIWYHEVNIENVNLSNPRNLVNVSLTLKFHETSLKKHHQKFGTKY